MSQHDFDITTADANTGTTIRAAINAALQALASNNSGADAPATTYANMWWPDSDNNRMWQRSNDNTAWVDKGPLDAVHGIFSTDLTVSGMRAGKGPGSGSSNSTFGFSALNSLTTGYNNTAMGYNSMRDTLGGFQNTAIGNTAMRGNTTGWNNTAIGHQSCLSNTIGTQNTAVGSGALMSNISGIENTAVGDSALNVCTGGYNTAVGKSALSGLTTGNSNTAVGDLAGVTLTDANKQTTGGNCTFVGAFSGPSVASSNALVNAIAIGHAALVGASNSWIVGKLGTIQRIAEGSNAAMGAATLVAGTITVSNTKVTANSRIFLTPQDSSGTPGHVRISGRVAGTSFTITSSSAADTSLIAWEIKEPQ